MLEILLLSFALATDAFAVGLISGVKYKSPRQIFRLSFHFGFFQFLLSLLGATILLMVEKYVAIYDHWIALILLSGIGLRMIRNGMQPDNEVDKQQYDATKGFMLVGLSIAVSIDALAAGVSIPALTNRYILSAILIGIVAGTATFLAMKLSGLISIRFAKRSEIYGGIVLILLGIHTVLSHSDVISF